MSSLWPHQWRWSLGALRTEVDFTSARKRISLRYGGVRHLSRLRPVDNCRNLSDLRAPRVAAPWQETLLWWGVDQSGGALFAAHFHEFSLIRPFLSLS